VQSDGLAFGTKNLIVKSAVVQSFNLGSNSSGTVKFAGLARSLGPWAVFGGVGSINQTSINTYRTDIQIKVEDDAGKKGFLNYSLPFAITLAIEPGESIRIYFAKGGLEKPVELGDFRLDGWTPFVAENMDTGQLIPIAGLPTLGPPKKGLLGAAIVASLVTFIVLMSGSSGGTVGFFFLVTLPLIAGAILRSRRYSTSLAESVRRAAVPNL
jgi:hypothetical protein